MKYINIIQLVAAIVLIIAILLQNQSAGLSGVFGGGGEVFRTKRGLEKKLFILTIILSIIFLGLSLLDVIY